MGSAEALQAAKVYRHLLKAVKKHIGTEEHKIHFTDFIKQEFQKSRQQFDPSFIQQKAKLARDFTFLLNSVHHHKDLLFSYNIAVDRSDEMKKYFGNLLQVWVYNFLMSINLDHRQLQPLDLMADDKLL